MKTQCHQCHGEGWLIRPVMAVNDAEGIVGEAAQRKPCDLCAGTSWLPGFMPPV